jgi:L-aspartate oxidase
MASTALLVAASALARQESRGGHYRSDHPAQSPVAWRTMTTLAKAREIAENLAEQQRAPQPITA